MKEESKLANLQISKLLIAHRATMIDKYLTGLKEEWAELFDKEQLLIAANVHFKLLTEAHVPIEQHELFELFCAQCKKQAENEVPLSHLIFSVHKWRSVIMDTLTELVETDAALSASSFHHMKTINLRLDRFLRLTYEHYNEHLQSIKLLKSHRMDELHEDRLYVIGKLAPSMAHEIRNHLTPIEGFLKLIRNHLQPNNLDKIAHYLDVIQGEFEGLYRLITGLLSFSKKQSLQETMGLVSVQELIASVHTLSNPRLINENIAFNVNLHSNFELLFSKIELQHILSNLLNNGIDALAATDASNKEIQICTYENQNHYYIDITNNGPEIPGELRDNIFSPFVTSKSEGTGLGLSICKQLMMKNGGDITFASSERQTTFTLCFQKNPEGIL